MTVIIIYLCQYTFFSLYGCFNNFLIYFTDDKTEAPSEKGTYIRPHNWLNEAARIWIFAFFLKCTYSSLFLWIIIEEILVVTKAKQLIIMMKKLRFKEVKWLTTRSLEAKLESQLVASKSLIVIITVLKALVAMS